MAGNYEDRIIPACAGRTPAVWWMPCRVPDHPRVCGANAVNMPCPALSAGSSPRVRGELRAQRHPPERLRIIPACAGRTAPRARTRRSGSDHPRVCGANTGTGTCGGRSNGSSPRVRGERLPRRIHRTAQRIIPACAGRTAPASHPPAPAADHPRVCGANRHTKGQPMSTIGSSPRVRGELRGRLQNRRPDRIIPACAGRTGLVLGFYRPSRIIPACAGRTNSSDRSTKAQTDHPRVCGANEGVAQGLVGVAGSSPRVRGEPTPKAPATRRGRIIPACAGRTRSAPTPTTTSKDHPRVCGANQIGELAHG